MDVLNKKNAFRALNLIGALIVAVPVGYGVDRYTETKLIITKRYAAHPRLGLAQVTENLLGCSIDLLDQDWESGATFLDQYYVSNVWNEFTFTRQYTKEPPGPEFKMMGERVTVNGMPVDAATSGKISALRDDADQMCRRPPRHIGPSAG